MCVYINIYMNSIICTTEEIEKDGDGERERKYKGKRIMIY